MDQYYTNSNSVPLIRWHVLLHQWDIQKRITSQLMRATYQFKYNMHIITGGEEFRNRTNNKGIS